MAEVVMERTMTNEISRSYCVQRDYIAVLSECLLLSTLSVSYELKTLCGCHMQYTLIKVD
jgi:hypothetical protein